MDKSLTSWLIIICLATIVSVADFLGDAIYNLDGKFVPEIVSRIVLMATGAFIWSVF
ncbi:hypothetical protein KAJ61_02960 [Candidatus Parcubacteria bacterium]|nr:hypothetical protein [Candidatus Parcubacteria bacterium]